MAVFKDKEKTKDGRQWYFVSRKKIGNETKQFKSKKYLTKREAEEAEAVFILKRDNPLKKNFHIVALDYFEFCKKTKKESTVRSYMYDYNKHIRSYFERKDISSINIPDIKNWHESIDKTTLKVDAKNKVYSVFKSILDYAMKNYELERNVVAIYGRFQEKHDKIEEKKLRYITLEEFKQFISVVDDPLWHCFFTTAFYTGCRKGEMFALTWNDIDFENNNINIIKTLSRGLEPTPLITSTKTNQNRKVKMNRSLREEMIQYKKLRQQYNDFKNSEFVFGGTLPLSRTTVDRYKHYYFELSGVREITMHEFRHSAVTLLINEMLKQDNNLDINKTLFSLSSRFGHTPEVMLKTYAHFYEDRLQEPVVDILDNL